MLAPELWPGPPGRPVVTGPALHVQDWRGGPLAVLTKHKRPKPVVLSGARSDEFVFFSCVLSGSITSACAVCVLLWCKNSFCLCVGSLNCALCSCFSGARTCACVSEFVT